MLHRKCKCSRVTEEGIRSEFQREFNFFWTFPPFLPTSHYPQTVGKLEPKQTNEEKERKIPIEALKRYIQDAASIAPEASSPIDFRNFNNAHFRSDSPFSFCPLLANLQRGTSRFSNAWKEHTHTHTEENCLSRGRERRPPFRGIARNMRGRRGI